MVEASNGSIADQLDAISQGPKHSRFPRPNPLPTCPRNGYACTHTKHYARGCINHRCMNSYKCSRRDGGPAKLSIASCRCGREVESLRVRKAVGGFTSQTAANLARGGCCRFVFHKFCYLFFFRSSQIFLQYSLNIMFDIKRNTFLYLYKKCTNVVNIFFMQFVSVLNEKCGQKLIKLWEI